MKSVFAGLLCLAFTQPAIAETVQDQIISQLQAQGYSEFSVETTWLGRVRIEATDGDRDRELVFNPRTGEILRDRWDVLRDERDEDGDAELLDQFEDDDEWDEDDHDDGNHHDDNDGHDDEDRDDDDEDHDDDEDDDEDEDEDDEGDDD